MTIDFRDLDTRDDQGRFHVPDPELIETARAVAREFYAQAQALAEKNDKQYPRPSNKYAVHFYRAAELCRELALTPVEYVAIQLGYMAENGAIWPNGIANKAPFDQERNTRENRNLVALRRYGAQLDLFSARSKLYGPRLALKDPANDFSPLFRCVMARRNGLDDIQDRYIAEAVLELEATPVASELFDGELEFIHEWRRAYSEKV